MLIDQTERSDEVVTERQQDILNLIIDIFTKTHEPVGSKALQESINSSSATIRNDMAALEKQGLLEKAYKRKIIKKDIESSSLNKLIQTTRPPEKVAVQERSLDRITSHLRLLLI